MPWKPGQSGNPNGRPPKSRTLSAILERAGSRTVQAVGEDKRTASRRFIAQALWEMATTGECTLANGRTLKAEPQGWFDVVKFIYAQIDGPPPKDINLGGQDGNPISIVAAVRALAEADEMLADAEADADYEG